MLCSRRILQIQKQQEPAGLSPTGWINLTASEKYGISRNYGVLSGT